MSDLYIESRDLRCQVNGQELLNGVDIDVQAGDLVEVRGPNGSGKSTLLRILAGLFQPESGSIRRSSSPISYVGHRHGMSSSLTVFENLRWFQSIAGGGGGGGGGLKRDESLIASALDTTAMSIARDALVSSLSAGQVRRAALARLLAVPSTTWILDEPLTWLDGDGADVLATMIEEHRRSDGAVICATHRPIASEATRVIALPLE